MPEKTEEQLIQQEIKRREKFSKGIGVGTTPEPKPKKEDEDGVPKIGWRRHLEIIGETIKGK